jgi:hypothetical protein
MIRPKPITELVNGDAKLTVRIDAAPLSPFDFNFFSRVAGLKPIDPVCIHCGESIAQLNNADVWYHRLEDGPDRTVGCECHCETCDPRNGYTDGRECIKGEVAEPEEEADRG